MAMDSLIGELFDNRYRIERRIGTGGMADVFLARDESLGRLVAIKILAERYAQDEAFVERFRREASAAAGLSHPNIVSVYDRGQASGTSYIAMEYLNGPTLKDEITSRAPLPEAEVVNWATQALDALEYAHRQGVVHRDIKPHNMVLTDEGRLKVTDFGIARAANVQQMTEVGSIVGTAQYLSPEQARGLDVGPQSDLYSMGIVLYEMLTGELPFTGDSAVEIAMKQVSDPPPSIRKQNKLVSEGLEQVVMRALSKDPALRHQLGPPDGRRVAPGEPRRRRVERHADGDPGAGRRRGGRRRLHGCADERAPARRHAAAAGAAVGAEAERAALDPRPHPPDRERRGRLRRLPAAPGGGDRADPERELRHGQGAARGGRLQGAVPGQAIVAREEGRRRRERPERRVERRQELDGDDLHRCGAEPITVPDVRGKSTSRRQASSRSRGFKVDPATIQVDSAQDRAGTSWWHRPRPRAPGATRGQRSSLRVATGNVVVPDVAGLNCNRRDRQDEAEDARRHLSGPPSDPAASARLSTPPAGRGDRPQNSAVTILISSGPQQVTVPPVVGETKQDALKALPRRRPQGHDRAGRRVPGLHAQQHDPVAGSGGGHPGRPGIVRDHRRPQVPASRPELREPTADVTESRHSG